MAFEIKTGISSLVSDFCCGWKKPPPASEIPPQFFQGFQYFALLKGIRVCSKRRIKHLDGGFVKRTTKHTLPETSSYVAPKNMPFAPKGNCLVFQRSIFQGLFALSFREGSWKPFHSHGLWFSHEDVGPRTLFGLVTPSILEEINQPLLPLPGDF